MSSTTNRSIKQPEDEHQRLVNTIYGKGEVIRTHPSEEENGSRIYEINLLSNEKEENFYRKQKSFATLYTCDNPPGVNPNIDDEIICQFGRGKIVSKENESCKIKLTSWRLNGSSFVYCYLRPSSFDVVCRKVLGKMNCLEKVMLSQAIKKSASIKFQEKLYREALKDYENAVDIVKYLQHDNISDNYLRAQIVQIMITCNNNEAICCLKINDYSRGLRYAQNALLLINALEQKRGSKIHSFLLKESISDVKLFGEWKVKSMVNIAKASMNKDYDKALEKLEQAKKVISAQEKTVMLINSEKEISRLRSTLLIKKKAFRKKEKLRAMAMFGSNGKSNDVTPKKNMSENNTKGPTIPKKEDETCKKKVSKNKRIEGDMNKKVSFEEDFMDEEECSEENVEEPTWYSQHAEALLISALGIALIGGLFFLKSNKK